MHQHTYVTLADAEARALPCEVGGLRYANVKVGHWAVRILTYICEAFSVILAEDTAEFDCAVAESLRLVLVPRVPESSKDVFGTLAVLVRPPLAGVAAGNVEPERDLENKKDLAAAATAAAAAAAAAPSQLAVSQPAALAPSGGHNSVPEESEPSLEA